MHNDAGILGEKGNLRRRMRAQRRAMSADAAACAREAFLCRLSCFAPYAKAATVMAYAARGNEPDLDLVIDHVLAGGCRLALPRCGAPGEMTARLVTGRDQLQRGEFGIMEPQDGCPVIEPHEIDLVLVPGIAFDGAGRRLGQGGGYYDRFLPGTNALRVGVLYEEELVDCVPAGAHDCAMDALLTPQRIIITNHTQR